ncbi:hypothetical protein HPB50_005629 [Hyalomma asiaticum]|uniref:Uncharacterized protein n=1 Tax=Hyalomma asiaticum TaxID=266040 RepID=A0ACB7RUG5_HYAAI|nr:hypothetical protein HPB50_005629 [Hyalomma asiaticum]
MPPRWKEIFGRVRWGGPDARNGDRHLKCAQRDHCRAAQRLNLSSKRRRRHAAGSTAADGSQSAADGPVFVTRYAELLRDSPPAVPPALLRGLSRKDTGLGKVKVMLRVCPAATSGGESSSSSSTPSHSPAHEPGTLVHGISSFLQLDSRKKQVTLYDPTVSGSCGGSADRASSGDEATTPSSPSSAPARLTGVAAPKMFAFDAVFSQDATQAEVCSSALTELVQAVVNGTDACLFVYGPAGLGESATKPHETESGRTWGIFLRCVNCDRGI